MTIQMMLLGSGAAGTVNPFDDMSNFSGGTRISGTDRIYYSSSGSYSFIDPNSGLSKFRFTVVGGGGASDGDNYGWFANTGGGGGGGVRAEIQTAEPLTIGVGQGGASAGYYSSSISARDASWFSASLNNSSNGISRVKGRGGESFVKKTSDGSYLLKATGGNTGVTRYHFYGSGYDNHINYINAASGSGYSALGLNGNRGYFYNGGYGYYNVVSGITTSNISYHYGGIGGCAAHNSSHSGVSGYHKHPDDSGAGAATNGENTTYSGAGGGGGADGSDTYGTGSPAGGAGGTASGLATLLSGSGITAAGGSGSNYGAAGNAATAGAAGGGYGGNSVWNSSTASWPDSFTAATGIVIVEFLGF